MTGLDNIIESVLEEAKLAAKKTIDEASSEAETRISQAKKQAEEMKANAEIQAKTKAQSILERGKSTSQRKIRQILLERKQALIRDTVEKAYQQLLNMSAEEYHAFVLKRLENLPEEIEGKLQFVPRNGEIVDKLLKKDLKKLHPGLEIMQEPLEEDGGFILTIGQIEENGTFRALLEENIDSIRDQANILLFEEAVE